MTNQYRNAGWPDHMRGLTWHPGLSVRAGAARERVMLVGSWAESVERRRRLRTQYPKAPNGLPGCVSCGPFTQEQAHFSQSQRRAVITGAAEKPEQYEDRVVFFQKKSWRAHVNALGDSTGEAEFSLSSSPESDVSKETKQNKKEERERKPRLMYTRNKTPYSTGA
jgi:hypothetical protein